MLSREQHPFPTRQYPYRRRSAVDRSVAADEEAELTLPVGVLHRFVAGLDAAPHVMPPEEVAAGLRDPFAELLLKRGAFPLTCRSLLAELDARNDEPGGLPDQRSFLAADGGQLPWSPETDRVNRFLRFAVVRSRGDEVGLMVSTSTAFDSERAFLQVIGWDPHNEVYHYYERRGGTWIWAGDSRHALAAPTRGQGPFDSHVNGSLVMKELRFPWTHWNSDSARIHDHVLAPDDPLRDEPLFQQRRNAEELERFVVRPGINRWTQVRLKRARRADGTLADVPHFMRQVLETTTVNLASSARESHLIADDDLLTLPITFFFNAEALLDYVGLEPDLAPVHVEGRHYRESLRRFEFALTDGSDFRQAGDTFFAFLVPEPAFEDLDVLRLLLQERIIGAKFGACLLMVDFPNPVFSLRRRALLEYTPATARLAAGSSDLEARFVAAVEQSVAGGAGQPPGSPEREFLELHGLPDAAWRAQFERRIADYVAATAARARTQDGFDDLVRLAESRRRQFRRSRLAEFDLTVPVTNIPPDAPTLCMREDGTIGPVADRPA